jgi:hypothetical protein
MAIPQQSKNLKHDKYTKYGIAEIILLACESNDGADQWKKNVSKLGLLRTILGDCTIFPDEMYSTHKTTTKEELLEEATYIDDLFGRLFKPPIR